MNFECPVGAWEVSDTTESGWCRQSISEADAAAHAYGCVSSVVVHRGKIVASVGQLKEKVLVRSIRKSILSALIGIEVYRGTISLSDNLRELDIDDVEGLSDLEKQATVGDLIKSRSGVYHPALAETPGMTAAKPPRGSKIPGAHWLYNNWDFNVLGTIYERATGRAIFDGIVQDIATPIGMEDFSASDGRYLIGRQSWHPAYHINMTSRDLARFGWLYLNEGIWNGLEIVPRLWVQESVRAHSFDGTSGYGYMWWTTGEDGMAQNGQTSIYRKNMPHFRYFAHGAYGQMIAVMPEKELVIAHLAETRQRTPAESLKMWEYVASIMEAQARL